MKCYQIIIWLTLLGCASEKKSSARLGDDGKATIEVEDQILFVNFRINQKEGAEAIEMISQKIVPGKFKENSFIEHSAPGDLKIAFKDGKGLSLKLITVEDPLTKRLESFNEGGEITSTIVQLDSADFFIRTNYDAVYRSIVVSRAIENETFKQLGAFNLDLK